MIKDRVKKFQLPLLTTTYFLVNRCQLVAFSSVLQTMPGRVNLGGKWIIAWPERGQRNEGPRKVKAKKNVEEGKATTL